MARTLRHVAHINGAHLVYLGSMDGKRIRSDTATHAKYGAKMQLDGFRRILNTLIFSGLEKKMYAGWDTGMLFCDLNSQLFHYRLGLCTPMSFIG